LFAAAIVLLVVMPATVTLVQANGCAKILNPNITSEVDVSAPNAMKNTAQFLLLLHN